MYLVFSTIEKAIAANLQIFENYARSKSEVIRTATDDIVDPSTISAGGLIAMIYVIGGYRQNQLQLSEGHTTSWAKIHECVNGDGHVIPKPDDSLMTGVVYDSMAAYNQEWYTDETI